MEKHLLSISKWGKITGGLFIAIGGIQVLFGWTSFGFGIIAGIIQIILGSYLYRSAKQADLILQEYNEEDFVKLTEHFAHFLKVNGIWCVISFILSFLMFLVSVLLI